MTQQQPDDLIWRTAWAWVRREHDRHTFDEAARADMVAWLRADPAHRTAYDKAARLWLLAGLVPPAIDVEAWKKTQGNATPGAEDDAT